MTKNTYDKQSENAEIYWEQKRKAWWIIKNATLGSKSEARPIEGRLKRYRDIVKLCKQNWPF